MSKTFVATVRAGSLPKIALTLPYVVRTATRFVGWFSLTAFAAASAFMWSFSTVALERAADAEAGSSRAPVRASSGIRRRLGIAPVSSPRMGGPSRSAECREFAGDADRVVVGDQE